MYMSTGSVALVKPAKKRKNIKRIDADIRMFRRQNGESERAKRKYRAHTKWLAVVTQSTEPSARGEAHNRVPLP